MPTTVRTLPLLLTALLAAGCAGIATDPPPPTASSPAAREGTVVYIVRHAEKATAERNTSLETGRAGEGVERARALADLLAAAGIDHVFATEWCRTAQTADPTARAAGLTIRYQTFDSPEAGLGPEQCEPDVEAPVEPLDGVDDEAAFAAAILDRGAGMASLVVGHSNTVPALVAALGAPEVCPELVPFDEAGRCWLPDGDYHHLFVVRVPAEGSATVERLDYGAPSSSVE